MHSTTSTSSTAETKSFAKIFEEEWAEQSDTLEEKHFDAAFEAKVAENDMDSTTTATAIDNNNGFTPLHTRHQQDQLSCQSNSASRKKSNCYSPYVPSNALRIQGMIDFVQFRPTDIFCDMGCGDGRVCFVVAVTQDQQRQQRENISNGSQDPYHKFRAIGIDVSKDCIDMAKQHLISNRHLTNDVKECIQFYQADLAIQPSEMLSGMIFF
jgi:2-polyprenyl-3-methyl-5-hydroxy-6-metoxy-1,4-benzoquinol methylase